jgi:hypothetical protein
MQALVARVHQRGDRHAAGHNRMVLLFLRDELACLIAIELNQHMTKCRDVLVFRAVLTHRVDAQK